MVNDMLSDNIILKQDKYESGCQNISFIWWYASLVSTVGNTILDSAIREGISITTQKHMTVLSGLESGNVACNTYLVHSCMILMIISDMPPIPLFFLTVG